MPKPGEGIVRLAMVLIAFAVLAHAPRVAAQEPGSAQQIQAEIPEDWIQRAGICRRTAPHCEGRSTTAVQMWPEESVDPDGRLDESIWRRVSWISDFIQIDPIEGARPTVRTEVAFAYDETTLYVAGRMYDPDPTGIRANLARRDDNGESDRLKISIDSYLNRQTSYTFAVTAAGGRVDYFTPSDGRGGRDYSYEPIWVADAEITDEGWFAEMAIPFSQLRFNQSEKVLFGVNINRYMPSRDEDLFWAPVPKDQSGWTSWFGDLEGLEGIETRRPLELVPYVASEVGVTSPELLDPANPFTDRTEFGGRVGADLKIGIGSSLTLDATFNPDFGQIEADPAEVNLSAFPTFFRERRPFFVENANLLGARGLFFSRRLGERPHGSTPGTYADVPRATTILGAAKLTGRTSGGLSMGALGAVTAEESAEFVDADADGFGRVRVEPATGWLVLRGLQEFGTANNELGLAFTGVRRDLLDEDPLAARLNRQAYAGGVDLQLQFDGGLTQLNTFFQGSRVTGTPEAIGRVQRFSSHYLQRPDAGHVEFDPTRTSLTGYRGELQLTRRDGEHWRFESYARATSPEFEINDAGALSRADRIESGIDLTYAENRHGRFRNWSMGTEAEIAWNFAGDRLFTELEGRGGLRFRNFWVISAEIDIRPGSVSDTRTRGGPLMGTATEIAGEVAIETDSRRRLTGAAHLYVEDDNLGGSIIQTAVELDYRPAGAWYFSLGAQYTRSVDSRQYVTTLDTGGPMTFGRRYVFGQLDRHTLSAQLRVDYAFTPALSLEGYFEPFVATGKYSEFGELLEPGTTDLRLYGTDGTMITESAGPAPHTITVRDGEDEFAFIREDFRAPSFRSNLVMRWEWLPGSTLFAVWQLDRGDLDFETGPGAVAVGNLLNSPGEPGRSFFAVKATYWLPM